MITIISRNMNSEFSIIPKDLYNQRAKSFIAKKEKINNLTRLFVSI